MKHLRKFENFADDSVNKSGFIFIVEDITQSKEDWKKELVDDGIKILISAWNIDEEYMLDVEIGSEFPELEDMNLFDFEDGSLVLSPDVNISAQDVVGRLIDAGFNAKVGSTDKEVETTNTKPSGVISDSDIVAFRKLSVSGSKDEVLDFLSLHKQEINEGRMMEFICYLSEKGRKDVLGLLHRESTLSDKDIRRAISWINHQIGSRFDKGNHNQMIDYLTSLLT
jgi:hypothetical protein